MKRILPKAILPQGIPAVVLERAAEKVITTILSGGIFHSYLLGALLFKRHAG